MAKVGRKKIYTEEELKQHKRIYQNQYDKKNLKKLTFSIPLEFWTVYENHLEEIESSQAKYTIQAVKEKLIRDGVDVDGYKNKVVAEPRIFE